MNECMKVFRGAVFWFNPNDTYNDSFSFTTPSGESRHSNLQGSNRPWVVVSNNEGNASSTTCTIVPLTLEDKPFLPSHVRFYMNDKLQTALCEQIRTVDIDALGYYCCSLSKDTMERIDTALSIQLGLCDAHLESRIKILESQMATIMEYIQMGGE